MSLLEEYYSYCEKHRKEEEGRLTMIQAGGFFECYDNDVQGGKGCGAKLSQLLTINLTRKNKNKSSETGDENAYMCGFPLSSLNKYVTKLNDLGYSVAVYKQSEDNKKFRYLQGIYTPTIRIENNDEETNDSIYHLSFTVYFLQKYPVQQGRVRTFEYSHHYCIMQLSTGQIYMGENIDNEYDRMIQQFLAQNNSREVFYYFEGFESEELQKIQELLPNETLQNWYSDRNANTYNEQHIENYTTFEMNRYPEMEQCISKGLQFIQKHDSYYLKGLRLPEDAWVKNDQLPIVQYNRDLFRELFLFSVNEERQHSSSKKSTVFDILSNSMNVMAKRNLRKILQYPKTSPDAIQRGYESIQNCSVTKDQKKYFTDLFDVEWYYLRWYRENLSFKCLSKLLKAYQELECWYSQLKPFNDYIRKIWNLETMKNFPNLCAIHEDYFLCDYEEHEKLTNLKGEIYEIYTKIEKFEKDGIVLVTNVPNVEEYYFQVSSKKWSKLSRSKQDQYRVIEKKATNIKILPHPVDSLLRQLGKNMKILRKLQAEKFEQYQNEIFSSFDELFCNFHKILINDCTFSILKDFFSKNDYHCPVLSKTNEKGFCHFENLRHVIVEQIDKNNLYVPLSFKIDQNQNIASLIYGMNSSGKSTFMKSIGLSLWLAQCGLFVPASSFHFSPYSRIFSKFNHSDNLYCGHSLFVSEMSDLDYILKHSTDNTLLLMDELTSGTEVHSASALIIAMMEEFLKNNISFCFTSHIHWIGEYVKKHLKVNLFHFTYDATKDIRKEKLLVESVQDFYNRELKSGSGPITYGVEVAEKIGISASLIKRAYQIRKGVHFFYEPYDPEKNSRYNSSVKMEKCVLCHETKNLHCHHIFPQQKFDSTNILQGFRKDGKYNLVILCQKCHDSIHHP